MPEKNIRPLGRHCLLDRAVEVAVALGGEVVISTDYDRHLFHTPERAILVARPPHLATRDASMWEVVKDLARTIKIHTLDTVVLLQPTSLHPHRAAVVTQMLQQDARPSLTVERFPEKWHPWYAMTPDSPNHVPASRHGLPARFRPNGLAYIMSGHTARCGTFWDDRPAFYEIDGVLNIDSQADWEEAVRIYG